MKREIGLTVCVALAAGMAFGATVTTNGAGAVTIDVPADETYVYPAPLANDIKILIDRLNRLALSQ